MTIRDLRSGARARRRLRPLESEHGLNVFFKLMACLGVGTVMAGSVLALHWVTHWWIGSGR